MLSCSRRDDAREGLLERLFAGVMVALVAIGEDLEVDEKIDKHDVHRDGEGANRVVKANDTEFKENHHQNEHTGRVE